VGRNLADFHSSILYHGTSASLPTGGEVSPQGMYPTSLTSNVSKPMVYATKDLDRARGFAETKASEQGHLFGVVYKVKPQDEDTVENNIGEYARSSDKPMKIEGVHEFVPNTKGLSKKEPTTKIKADLL
jgi:hypothetical protein